MLAHIRKCTPATCASFHSFESEPQQFSVVSLFYDIKMMLKIVKRVLCFSRGKGGTDDIPAFESLSSEGSSEYGPRAVIYDFYCDPNAGIGRPLSVVEWPTYTYKGKGGRSDVIVLHLCVCVCVVCV